MARRTAKAVVDIDNVEATIRLMNNYGRDFSKLVRDDVQKKVAPYVATGVRGALAGAGGQVAKSAGTVRVARDRLPAIRVAGARRVHRDGTASGDTFFGGNWGAGTRRSAWYARRGYRTTFNPNTVSQFPSWRPSPGDPMYGWISDNNETIERLWQNTIDDVYKAWNGGR